MKRLQIKGNAWLIVCFGAIALAYLVNIIVFQLYDTGLFTRWSVSFWEVLFNGNFSLYYEYTAATGGAPQGSYLTFFPWIIWNLPLYILTKDHTPTAQGIVWTNLLPLLCLIILCVYIYKITMRLTQNDAVLSVSAAILTSASLEIIDSVAYTGQDEIIYLCTFIMCLYHSMLGHKVKALLLGIVSVTICPLMIIPYCFILLIYVEKIVPIVVNLVASVIPTFLFEVIYRNNDIYVTGKQFNTVGLFQIMMNTCDIHTALENIPVGAVILIILACYCFFVKSKKENDEKSIAVLSIVFFCLNFLMSTNFYRGCLYVPFFAISACSVVTNRPYRIMAFMITSIARFYHFLTHTYNYNSQYIYAPLAKYLSINRENLINFSKTWADCSLYIVRSIAFAFAIVFFVLYYCPKPVLKENKISMKFLLTAFSCLGIIFTILYLVLI